MSFVQYFCALNRGLVLERLPIWYHFQYWIFKILVSWYEPLTLKHLDIGQELLSPSRGNELELPNNLFWWVKLVAHRFYWLKTSLKSSSLKMFSISFILFCFVLFFFFKDWIIDLLKNSCLNNLSFYSNLDDPFLPCIKALSKSRKKFLSLLFFFFFENAFPSPYYLAGDNKLFFPICYKKLIRMCNS